ncbi:MAG: PfkB family carbohydrate kinase [SAR324 cluster bacterium]|nr:PfkB family carbohydrate kinase [SAR324 cluster bacterium]
MNNPDLRRALEKIVSPRILVVGDLMLDHYSWGEVDRISPEAPIPVMRVLREEQRLGGAGNVVMNLSMLGAEVLVCGVTGKDETGNKIGKLLAENGVDYSGMIVAENYKSCLKHRMIAGQTHLLRMDIDPDPETPSPQRQLIDYLEKTIPSCDAVIVSDYGKGLLSSATLKAIAACGKNNEIPVVGDPRSTTNYKIYQNFTLIKPNRKETEAAVGFKLKDQKDVLKAAEILQSEVKLKYLVISLDQDGLLLFSGPQDYHFLAAETKEVFDVVGAGDAVSSLLTFMLAGKSDIEQAAYWAQLAASMEIQHVGVVSFSKNELLQRFDIGETSAKIMTPEQLCRSLPQEQPVVFTNGFFDEISAGHLKFLHQLKTLKGFNVVAINSDQSIAMQKGQPPLLNERERALLLSAIEAVDRVVIFDEQDASSLIRTIRPQTVVKGEHFRKKKLPEKEAIKETGAKLEYFPEY